MSIFILENISKVFKGTGNAPFALKNISLTFDSVGLVSIIGKSGSGKSTLLNILLGSERPTSGNLYFENRKINKLSDRTFSKQHLLNVSMVFQHYNLFDELTAKENIVLPLLIKGTSKLKANRRAEDLLSKFNLNYLANQKTKLLSGGEKQRVAILRALITTPKVLLCDEPTGALDSENSILIMEILKKLSQSMLVIVVSHNKSLVERYSDRIITLKDGKVENDRHITKADKAHFVNKKYSYSNKWTSKFTKLNLKLNLKKNIFSIISCTIGFAAIFLSFGFYFGSEASQENALNHNLAIQYATASETTFYEIENSPLSYEKSVRPSLLKIDKHIKDFENIKYELNLSYLFSPYPYGSYQGSNIEGFQLVPTYDLSLNSIGSDLLVSGTPPDVNKIEEVIVNEEFVKLLNKTNDSIIDDNFVISSSSSISFQTGDLDNPIIKEEYSYSFNLRIAAVIKEFSFLNTPKIYYSYPALKSELSNTYMENISEYLGEPTSFYEYVDSVNNDDPVSSYSYCLFLTSIKEAKKFFSLIEALNAEEIDFKISSSAFDIKQSYSTFISSFSTALFVFVIIAFIGVNFILGMISLSTFIENKKNSAVLTCLGAKHGSIQSIFLSENYFLVIIAIFLSVGLAIGLEILLNNIISANFALDNLIDIPFYRFFGVPFGLPIAISIVALVFSTIFTLVPMNIYRHISLSEELRDE